MRRLAVGWSQLASLVMPSGFFRGALDDRQSEQAGSAIGWKAIQLVPAVILAPEDWAFLQIARKIGLGEVGR